jgi:hypothetical protein
MLIISLHNIFYSPAHFTDQRDDAEWKGDILKIEHYVTAKKIQPLMVVQGIQIHNILQDTDLQSCLNMDADPALPTS